MKFSKMNIFKPGDIVICTNNINYANYLFIDEKYTIHYAHYNHDNIVKLVGDSTEYNYRSFKLDIKSTRKSKLNEIFKNEQI